MKTKRAVVVFFISIAVIAVVLGVTGRTIHAQGSEGSDSSVLAKLDTVLRNQTAIMADLASIKEDLRIIKIRVTQSQ